jgi:hypothetical protein
MLNWLLAGGACALASRIVGERSGW